MNDQPMSEDYASLEVKYPDDTVVRHTPDPPPQEEKDAYLYYFNRYAEEMARWLRALGLLLIVFWVTPAHAQQPVAGIYCDTEDEITALIEYGNAQEAMDIINAYHENSCGTLVGLIQRGATKKTIRAEGLWDITPVLLVGAVEDGVVQRTRPSVQWTAFRSLLIEATWVPRGDEDPKIRAWFARQQIMPLARVRIQREYGKSWEYCCDHADHVRVKFVMKDGQYWAYPIDGAAPFLLPADTIHPTDADVPDQLAVEGVVMVVHKGSYGADTDIIVCVWLPQTGG